MAQRIPHSVLIDGGSHIVRMRFHLIDRIAHRHTNAGSTKHGAVVTPVAKRHGLADVKTKVVRHGANTPRLVRRRRRDVAERRIPTR